MLYSRKLDNTHIELLLDNTEAKLIAEWINYIVQHSNLSADDIRRYRNFASDIFYNVEKQK